MPAVIEQIATIADGVNPQCRSRLHTASIGFEAQQCPMRTGQQFEQTPRLPACPAHGRIGSSIASTHAARSMRRFHRERRTLIPDIQLMDFATSTDVAALGCVEQLSR
jgi:hypothetical protein